MSSKWNFLKAFDFRPDPSDPNPNPHWLQWITGQDVGKRRGLNVFELNRSEKTAFDEQVISEKTVLIELKSAVNDVSELRNIVTETGSATVTLSQSEYKLSTTATSGDGAAIESAETGRYIPGYQAECGIGIRIPDTSVYTGDLDSKWGYYNGTDGYFFGYDANGPYVGIRRSSTDTKIYQADWNQDKVDGTGESQYTLDYESGNIFEIDFVWYGYGAIRFYVIAKNADFNLGTKKILIHTIIPDKETSVQQPNLPIKVETDNGTSAMAHDLYVGGRQFSIYGDYNPVFRLTGEFRTSVSIGTTWAPIISFRRKSASIFQRQPVEFDDLRIHADGDMIVGFVINGVLTGASWGAPTRHDASETVVESDTSATVITGGIQTGGFFDVPGGAGSKAAAINLDSRITDLINSQPFTLVARSKTGTVTIETVTMNVREEW